MRKNDMNIWWGMWWLAVAIFFAGLVCLFTGCGTRDTAAPAEARPFEQTVPEQTAAFTAAEPKVVALPPIESPVPAPTQEPVTDTEVEEEAPPAEPELLGWFKVTAYCPCVECCEIWSAEHPSRGPDYVQKTATGTIPTEGRTIAVDPDVIPYGTVVYFEGPDGNTTGYVAEDCGGAIKGNRIDLYFESHDEANRWGVRERDVYLMPEAQT